MESSFRAGLLILLTFSILSAALSGADRLLHEEAHLRKVRPKNPEPGLDFREDFEFDLHLNRELLRNKKELIDATHYKITPQSDVDLNLFRLKIKVLGCKRSDSLLRLFNSLLNVDFQGDSVDIDIYLDFPSDMFPTPSSSTPKKPVLADELSWTMHEEAMATAEKLKWPHGYKKVHERIFNVGGLGQWLEAWTPAGPHEYALFLEDDMEVSPYFYRWLKIAISHYSRPSHPILRRVFGLSLQMLTTIASTTSPLGTLPIENWNMPVAYQLTGTWGQVMFPGPWRDFRTWFREHRLIPGFKPLVDNLKSTQLYMKIGDQAWEQWLIRWAHEQGRFCIYSNFANRQCLATNHREDNKGPNNAMGPDCQLVIHRNMDFLNFAEVPQLYNFSMLPVNPATLPPLPEDL